MRSIALSVVLLLGAPSTPSRGQETPSLRSVERLRLDCSSTLDHRDLTLFGNGTLRLRQGEPGKESMWLRELGPDQLHDYLVRLAGVSRVETDFEVPTVSGDWIEHCSLVLGLDGRPSEHFEFGRYDSLSLDLQRTLAIALELIDQVDTTRPAEGEDRLPTDYRPQLDDELRRADGFWFRVQGFTVDGDGVELAGEEQPLVLYVAIADLSRSFVAFRRAPHYGR